MKNKQMFINALETLFYSWSADATEEVYWTANLLLDWYEVEFNCTLGIRFKRDPKNYDNNFDDVIDAIINS